MQDSNLRRLSQQIYSLPRLTAPETPRSETGTYHARYFPVKRAACRIRTDDPEITSHVLWPAELRRLFRDCTPKPPGPTTARRARSPEDLPQGARRIA